MPISFRLTLGYILCLCLAGCSVKIADQTPTALTRNNSSIYDVSARVTGSGSVEVLGVTALINGSPFPLSAAGDNLWTGSVAINPCRNGFDLVYEAEWDAPFSGGTEVEPSAGVTQKWLTGNPPSSCPAVFGMNFTVDSQADAPDANPGDGVCETSEDECTLRAAVMEANATPGTDRIRMPSGTYDLTRTGSDDTAQNGDLDVLESVTIEPVSGTATIDAEEMNDRVFDIFDGDGEGVVTLRNVTLRNGRASTAGGGIWNRAVLFLDEVTIEDSRAGRSLNHHGGGLYTQGTVFATRVFIRRNQSGHLGGGIAIAEAGSVVLTQSAVTENQNGAQHGGGIAIIGGSLEAQNVTISGNESLTHGGGVWANTGSKATFLNVTIARNRSDADGSGGGNGGGVLLSRSDSPYRFGNSIIAENYRGRGVSPNDCSGTVSSLGYNLIEETSDCTIDGITAGIITGMGQADLYDLGFWGGSTPVHRLRPSSAAREGGNTSAPNDASILACRESDQRGNSRPGGGSSAESAICDIGAVEM